MDKRTKITELIDEYGERTSENWIYWNEGAKEELIEEIMKIVNSKSRNFL